MIKTKWLKQNDWNKMLNININFLIIQKVMPSPDRPPEGTFFRAINVLIAKFNEFIHIWSLTQWLSSLLGLIVLYVIAGMLYNKYLSEKGGTLSYKQICYLMLFDLTVNLIVGVLVMGMPYRSWVLGQFMLTCPIAISPAIFILELSLVYCVSRYFYNQGTPRESLYGDIGDSLILLVLLAMFDVVYRFINRFIKKIVRFIKQQKWWK